MVFLTKKSFIKSYFIYIKREVTKSGLTKSYKGLIFVSEKACAPQITVITFLLIFDQKTCSLGFTIKHIQGTHCTGIKNRENGQQNSRSGKTQGIWFAQVINSLILKVKDISIFAAKISKNFQFIFEGG